MSIPASSNPSIQRDVLLPTTVPPQGSLDSSAQPAPTVASRPSLIELLPDIRALILQFIAGDGSHSEVGERVHKCILNWKFACKQGVNWFKESDLSQEQKSALSLYRTPLIMTWRAAERAKVDLASLELLLNSSMCISTRFWNEKLTRLLLNKQFQSFSCEELVIDPIKAGSLGENFEKLAAFLSRHQTLADRPAIRVIQDQSFKLPQHFLAMAQALQQYKKGALELRLFVMSARSPGHDRPENVATLLANTANTGVIKKLAIDFQLDDDETAPCLALFSSGLMHCTSLESLFLHMPCIEYTQQLLDSAKRNPSLRHLRLTLSSGELKHLGTLPAFLKHFPELALLELRTLWQVSTEEMAALKKAVADQFPKLELKFYNDMAEV